MEEPRWIRCVGWTNESRLFQKGDRVRLTGYFEVRCYQKDGEVKRVRQFVVKTATLERAKSATTRRPEEPEGLCRLVVPDLGLFESGGLDDELPDPLGSPF